MILRKICEIMQNLECEGESPSYYTLSYSNGKIIFSSVKEDYSVEYTGSTGEDIETVSFQNILRVFDEPLSEYTNLILDSLKYKDLFGEEYGVDLNTVFFKKI